MSGSNELKTVGTVTTSNNVRQLSDSNPVGTGMGSSPTDLIGFFGAPPIQQPSGGDQQAQLAQAGGVLNTYAPTLSPSSVAANTTAEQTFTVTGLAAGSIVIVNKPTTQAGLGIAGVRVSAANTLAINFSNDTASPITPTASQVYTVIEMTVGLTFPATLSPAAVPANATSEQFFTVAAGNVQTGMPLQVNKPTSQAGLGVSNARVSAPNTLAITFFNNTASPITPTASEAYLFANLEGLSASSNVVVYDVGVGTLSSVATLTTAEQTIAVGGILASDVIMGVSKPTVQAGLGIINGRVVSAGSIGVGFINVTTATIVPTANEAYGVSVFRAQPVAPEVQYSQLLAPVSVAANTTAEQTFTVTGLVASTAVFVTKPSATSGLALVGYRVSGANTLAVAFQNDTAAAIVPPAEIYLISNFPQTEGGVETTQAVSNDTGNQLVNAIQGALVNLGLIAGS